MNRSSKNSTGIELGHRKKFAVVGAGVGGIIAAFELIERGVAPDQIVLLEAQDEIGGRAQTIRYGGRFFDIYAHWLHRRKKNLFYKWLHENVKAALVRQLGARSFQDLFVDDCLQNVWMIGGDGRVDRASTFRAAGRAAVERLYRDFKQRNPAEDISLADLVRGHGQQEKQFVALVSSTWMADHPKNISADEYFEEPAGSGGLQVKGGMGRIVHGLADILEAKSVQILTDHQVLVVRTGGAGMTLICQTPAGQKHIYADAVYMTPSVGVLQSGAIQFDPVLPPSARATLNRVKMSGLRKILMPFEDGFFSRQESPVVPDTRIDYVQPDAAPFFTHCRSAGAESMQIIGRDVATDDIQRVQQKITSWGDIRARMTGEPYLVDASDNPFLRGAYSICKVGQQRPEGNIVLHGRLVIGGEAFTSNANGASTVEGAVVSAMNAARELTMTPANPYAHAFSWSVNVEAPVATQSKTLPAVFGSRPGLGG